jgi:hypothetical protein
MKVVPETHIGTLLLMVICFKHLYASEQFGDNHKRKSDDLRRQRFKYNTLNPNLMKFIKQ